MKLIQDDLIEIERLLCQSELVPGLFHEVNNALTAVLGYTQLLMGSQAGREQEKTDLKAMEGEMLRSRRMIQSFLALFQPCQVVEGPLEMNSLLDLLLCPLQDQRRFTDIVFKKDLSPDNLFFRGTFPEWRVILISLLLRAARATNKGGVVQVTTAKRGKGECFELVIKSLNPGMERDALACSLASFRFHRGREVDLGIYLARRTARQSGGSLRVAGAPDGAQVIRLYLPLLTEE